MTRAAPPPVVVTGIGVVSAWGWTLDEFRAGLESGRTAITGPPPFDHDGCPARIAARVPDAGAPEPIGTRPDHADRAGRDARPSSRPGARRSRADRFAVAAALEAARAAGLPDDLGGHDAAVFFAGSTAGMLESEGYYLGRRGGGLDRHARRCFDAQLIGRPGEAVARRLRVTGPVETVSSACASATLAIGAALDALRAGEARVALAGGTDSLCRVTFFGFNSLKAVDPAPCRPFRRDRAGMSLGEGSAVLVLERLEEARRRGAVPLAEVCGAGSSGDAHHMTAPDPSGRGAAAAIGAALRDAGRAPEEIDLINAHGTGTPLNDSAEFAALRSVFGGRIGAIPIQVTKGSVGHLLGSAGAVEAVATILALRHRRLHPAPGAGAIDPETPVRLADTAAEVGFGLALSLNLGFGGCNAALVLARAPRDAQGRA